MIDPNNEMSSGSPDSRGLGRRTIVAGAAWTIPAVAVATAAPMAAASVSGATLTITPASTTMGVNSTTTLTVTLTTSSGSAAGQPVTITLPAGFTFASTGTNTTTLPTDGSGVIVLSDVTSSGVESSGTVTAVLDGDPTVTAAAQIKSVLTNIVFWGLNDQGQVGTTPPTVGGRTLSPTLSTSFPGAATLIGATESGITAIDGSGNAYVVGWNADYRLGTGDTTDQSQYVPAVGFTSPVVYLEANSVEERTSFAITADGQVWGNGWNETNHFASSTVPVGSTTQVWVPIADLIPVPAGERIVKVVQTNWGSAIYLLSNGEAYANGANVWGATAQGVDSGTVTAGRLLTAAGVALTDTKSIADVVQGEGSLLVVTTDGELWACGENDQGAVPGQALGTRTSYLHQVTLPAGKTASKVFSQEDFTYVVMTDGTVFAQGRNASGALGITAPTGSVNALTQVVLPAGSTVTKIASGNDGTIFLLGNGDVYFAGLNDTSGAGAGGINVPAASIYTPIQVPLTGPAIDITATWWDGYAAILA